MKPTVNSRTAATPRDAARGLSQASRFALVFERHPRGFVLPYFVLGYPDDECCLAAMLAAVEAGAPALELGVPFTDPIADGPTIQSAVRGVLARGFRVADAQLLVARLRERAPDIAIGLLTYANTLYRPGYARAAREWRAVGADAVLAADVPVEEAQPLVDACGEAGLGTVMLATPLTSEQRLARVAALSSAYIYVVARLGVTGERQSLDAGTAPLLSRLRALTNVPLACGFGIRDGAQVRAVIDAGASAAIVGSALVRAIGEAAATGDTSAVAAVVRERVRALAAGLTSSSSSPSVRA